MKEIDYTDISVNKVDVQRFNSFKFCLNIRNSTCNICTCKKVFSGREYKIANMFFTQ